LCVRKSRPTKNVERRSVVFCVCSRCGGVDSRGRGRGIAVVKLLCSFRRRRLWRTGRMLLAMKREAGGQSQGAWGTVAAGMGRRDRRTAASRGRRRSGRAEKTHSAAWTFFKILTILFLVKEKIPRKILVEIPVLQNLG